MNHHHLENLTDRPAKLQESIFNKLFEQAEISNFNDEEYSEYEASLKTYRDLKNSIDTAREEGIEKGIEKGRREEKIMIAGKLKQQNIPPEIISRSTGLPIEEIEKL
nr:PD-(D/E)XK nuclease family transposase [Candidatus Thiosymbion oneisti]